MTLTNDDLDRMLAKDKKRSPWSEVTERSRTEYAEFEERDRLARLGHDLEFYGRRAPSESCVHVVYHTLRPTEPTSTRTRGTCAPDP